MSILRVLPPVACLNELAHSRDTSNLSTARALAIAPKRFGTPRAFYNEKCDWVRMPERHDEYHSVDNEIDAPSEN